MSKTKTNIILYNIYGVIKEVIIIPYNAFKTDLPLILERLGSQEQPIQTAKLVLFFRTITGWREKTARSYIKAFTELGYMKKTVDGYNIDCYFLAPDVNNPNVFPQEKAYIEKHMELIKKAKVIK